LRGYGNFEQLRPPILREKRNTDTMSELIEKLKAQIIETLNLEDMSAADIDPEAPLFGEAGLGLDSIDALELIVLLDKEYALKLANPAEGQAVFHSVKSMADYITANGKG